MTLKATFAVLNLFHIPREIQRALFTICLHINLKAHVVCNFNYLFENEGLRKVTSSHVHCKCGNISETVRDSHCHYRLLIGSDIRPIE